MKMGIMQSVTKEEFLAYKATRMKKLPLPGWMLQNPGKCPSCSNTLAEQDLNAISCLLEAPDFGSVECEFLCSKCSASFSAYYVPKTPSFEFFKQAISSDSKPECEVSSSMVKRPNRLFDDLILERQASGKEKEDTTNGNVQES